MTTIDKILYPKIVSWNYAPEKLLFATIPANTKEKVAKLLEFCEKNSNLPVNFSNVELVDSIFPCDEITFFDKNLQVMLILNINELEEAFK